MPDQAKAISDSLAAAKDAVTKADYQTALTTAQALPDKITALTNAINVGRGGGAGATPGPPPPRHDSAGLTYALGQGKKQSGGPAMSSLLSVVIGIALSAACGFRVFVPLLVLSVAGFTGYLRLAPGFQWIGTYPAILAFATATLVEILAYYIPWVDHLLDLIAGPAALIAGMVATASVLADLPPLVRWSIALIGGGGMAGVIQGTTTVTRLKSTLLTGGLGNFVIATLELVAAAVTSLLAVFLPLLGLALVASLVFYILVKSRRFLFGRSHAS